MTDFVAADVTYTILNQRRINSKRHNRVQLAFGNSSLTYPAGGIPLSGPKLGCPTVVESLVVVAQGVSGYHFQYVQSTGKLVLMQAPAQTHTHDMTFIGGIATTEAVMIAAGDTLGKNAATDRTIAGAAVATKGGVVSSTLAAAALAQASTVAIAAQTIEVEVIGW